MKQQAIRVSAKAVIRHKGGILLVQMRDEHGEFYLLPGGGQNFAEPLVDTLRREVREETGAEVEPGELLFVRDYVSRHHEFAAKHDVHQVEVMFEARLISSPDAARASEPDNDQTGVVVLTSQQLADARFYPKALAADLVAYLNGTPFRRGYYGSVN